MAIRLTDIDPVRPSDMTVTVLIKRADLQDAFPLARLVAAAFHDLPHARWLVPDPAERAEILPGYFAILVEHGLIHGVVDTTPSLDAVAIWLPHTLAPNPPPDDYDARLADITGPWLDRFRTLDDLLDAHHPRASGHEHLAALAVRPGRQGQGVGSALLNRRHAHHDRHGVAGYVEARSTGSRDLYLRHGYVPFGARVDLPDGPPIWPLWRWAAPYRPRR